MAIFRRSAFYFALLGIMLAFVLIQKLKTPSPDPIHFIPALNPYDTTIAAAGIIESIDKNIEIGIPLSGIVKETYVKVGDYVKPGHLLFRLDDRELLAQFLVQRANVAISNAHHLRLKDQLVRLESIEDIRAISQDEINTRRFDVIVARAQLEAAEAQVTHTVLMIERLNICAPQQGVILQNNIRKGEFVTAGGIPAMLLGDIEHLQVRVDIDEQNASHLSSLAAATAFPKNNSERKIPLHFERIEPYVIPKRSLTGASDERVDTRVLQVIYSFEKEAHFPLYVGQQVDIFIEKAQSPLIAQNEDVDNAI